MLYAGYVHRKDSSVLRHKYTNNSMILGSCCFFFFLDSHSQQGSVIKYLPIANMFKKESLSSICEEKLIPAINMNIYTENPESHL